MPHFIDEESEIQRDEDLWDECQTKAPGSCPFAVLAPIFLSWNNLITDTSLASVKMGTLPLKICEKWFLISFNTCQLCYLPENLYPHNSLPGVIFIQTLYISSELTEIYQRKFLLLKQLWLSQRAWDRQAVVGAHLCAQKYPMGLITEKATPRVSLLVSFCLFQYSTVSS